MYLCSLQRFVMEFFAVFGFRSFLPPTRTFSSATRRIALLRCRLSRRMVCTLLLLIFGEQNDTIIASPSQTRLAVKLHVRQKKMSWKTTNAMCVLVERIAAEQ